MRVLLIYPPVRLGLPPRYPPMGLLHISSVLEEAGVEVDILDLNALRPEFGDVKRIIGNKRFDVVGLSGMTTVYYYLRLLSLYLKLEYPHVPIMGGGSGCSSTPETVLRKTGIDVVVMGEGEPIVVDLVQTLVNHGDLSRIPGMYYRDENGTIRETNKRERMKNISILPYPSYHLVDMELYIRNNSKKYAKGEELDRMIKERGLDPIKARRTFPIFTKRGCPYSCNFCYRNFGRRVSYFSVDYIMEQLKFIDEKYNATNIVISDELFNVNKKWCIEFCERVIQDGRRYVFSTNNGLRANLVDRELLEAMKEAGFHRVSIGVESFYDPTLKAMDKKQDAETIYGALKLARELGFATLTAMMLYGYESDSLESMKVNVQKLLELGFQSAGFSIPCRYPGTRLYRIAVERGLIPCEEEWLMELSDKDISEKVINLSNMSDKELERNIAYGQGMIKMHSLRVHRPQIAAIVAVLQPALRRIGIDALGILDYVGEIRRGKFPTSRRTLQGEEHIREEALELLPKYVGEYQRVHGQYSQ